MKACFISTGAVDPKMIKRIEIVRKHGTVSLLYARRKMYNADETVKGCDYYPMDIDLPDSNHLFKRLLVSLKFQDYARKKLKEINPDLLYAETLDALLVAARYKRKAKKPVRLFYEVSDIRTIYFKKQKTILKKLAHQAVSFLEKECFKSVDKLIVTSKKFYDVCYLDRIRKEDVIYLPNMHDLALFKNYRKKEDGEFTVGWVGGLRYIDEMLLLVKAAEKAKVNVLFAGADMDKRCDELREYCKDKPFVSFIGRYSYDREIVSIYEKLDCVYDVIDISIPNCRVALTNKLYEAAICLLPIIVPKETYLEETVNKWGSGEAITYDSEEELVRLLLRYKNDHEYYQSICENCKKVKDGMDIHIYDSLFEQAIINQTGNSSS